MHGVASYQDVLRFDIESKFEISFSHIAFSLMQISSTGFF